MKQLLWRRMLLLFCCVAFVLGVPVQNAAAGAKTTILLDGYPLTFPIEPKIMKGYTMVPFRAIAEALGIAVQWDAKTRSITAVKQSQETSKTVVLQLNNPMVTVNGQKQQLPVSPFESNGHTLIPLSFFSREFGAQVSWNGNTRTVTVLSPREKLYTRGFYAISSFSERSLIPSFDSVAFGWSRIDATGNVTLTGKDFYWPQPSGETTPENIIDESAAQGTSPYLMVFATDGTGELGKLLNDPNLQSKAISSIVQLAQEKHFAGVVLDFEGLGMNGDTNQEKQKYSEFVRQLSAQIHNAGLNLSLVLHPLNGAYQGYDYKTLGALADDLVIMAYAYENEKQPEPLGKVNEAIKLALAQVNKEKLILGISMGSENAGSVNSKIGLAKRYQLKGIALWRLGMIGQQAFDQMQNTLQLKSAMPVNQ